MATRTGLNRLGMLLWGGLTVLLALTIVFVVVKAAHYIQPNDGATPYKFVNAPQWVVGLFYALKEISGVIAGTLAASALAWSHFYKSASDTDADATKKTTELLLLLNTPQQTADGRAKVEWLDSPKIGLVIPATTPTSSAGDVIPSSEGTTSASTRPTPNER